MEQPDILVSELGCKFELTIVGETKARVSFEKFEGDILTVDAGSENLKFAPLENLGGHLASIISIELGLPRESFLVRPGLTIHRAGTCQIFVKLTGPKSVDLDRAHSAALTLLQQLKKCDTDTASLFPVDTLELKPETVNEISAATQSTLNNCGGSPISTPASIFFGDKRQFNFRGMYAARPDLSMLTAVPVIFEGKFDGYRLKKRAVFLEGAKKGLMVHWESDRDLERILELAMDAEAVYEFQLKKTFDKTGQPVFTLIDWKPLL